MTTSFFRFGSGSSAFRLACYSLFASLICANASAQLAQPNDAQLAELHRNIQTFMFDNNIPGGLVAVVSKGEMQYLRVYGMANLELSVPVTDRTVFEIGSISKQFVAAAAMLQVEEGNLDLDAAIHRYLPTLPSEWLGVTVRQLLNHTSGIPDYEEIRSYDVYRFRMTPEEVIRIAHSRPVDFAPGAGWNYSNTGYYILSLIVERIDGQPLAKVLRSRIFDPLGMSETRFSDPEAIIPDRAAGYWINKAGELINRNPTETSSTLGAGGMLTSVHDLMRWDFALYGDRLLSEKSKRIMWRPTILPDGTNTEYGLGWRVTPYGDVPSQGHSGQVAGFVANFTRIPDHEMAIIVFLNRYLVSTAYIRDLMLETFVSGE